MGPTMSFVLRLLVALCSSMVVVGQDCFNSTFKIVEAQLLNNNILPVMQEFIVCPNSTISLGVPDATLSDFVDGDWPLVPLGPNVTFKCGADGKSGNNCVLSGSFMHFLSLPNFPQVARSNIVTDNLYVSGFTLTGDGSSAVGGLLGKSIAINAPGKNQVFNDIIWQDAKFHYFVSVEETSLVPDEGLPNLSIEATLQNSEFRDVLYSRKLIAVTKQNLTIRDTKFVNVNVFNYPEGCNCTHQPIASNTGVGPDYTSTSDTYITLVNNCIENITSTNSLLEAVTNDTTSVIIGNENNHVTGWTILEESTSEKDVCTEGIAISTDVNGEFEECETFASAPMCSLDDNSMVVADESSPPSSVPSDVPTDSQASIAPSSEPSTTSPSDEPSDTHSSGPTLADSMAPSSAVSTDPSFAPSTSKSTDTTAPSSVPITNAPSPTIITFAPSSNSSGGNRVVVSSVLVSAASAWLLLLRLT